MKQKITFLSLLFLALIAVLFLYKKAVNFDRIYPNPLISDQNEVRETTK